MVGISDVTPRHPASGARAVDTGCRGWALCPTVVGMRIGRLLVMTALVLALVGCVPTGGHQSASPTPSATPVFASDAEALAAAEKAYAAYERAVDGALQSRSPDGLELVATNDALRAALSSVDAFLKAGRFQRGSSHISSVSAADLSALTEPGRADAPAQIYGCLDVSDVQVVDSTGANLSSSGRQTIFPTLVSLVWSPGTKRLLVSEESVWDGKNFCA